MQHFTYFSPLCDPPSPCPQEPRGPDQFPASTLMPAVQPEELSNPRQLGHASFLLQRLSFHPEETYNPYGGRCTGPTGSSLQLSPSLPPTIPSPHSLRCGPLPSPPQGLCHSVSFCFGALFHRCTHGSLPLCKCPLHGVVFPQWPPENYSLHPTLPIPLASFSFSHSPHHHQ